MNGMSGKQAAYALHNNIVAYRNRKLDKLAWKNNLLMAKRSSRARIAREKKEGCERSHALTDINRKVIKKKMMTIQEAYERNRITKPYGMFWVLCG